MKIYICDNEEIISNVQHNKDNIILCDDKNINNCRGCFMCWIKHPMECCYKNDELSKLSKNILDSDEIIVITKIKNGCYSSKVKKILERIIGVVEPFFSIRQGEIHHKLRKLEEINFQVWIYGEFTKLEREIFENLCLRNKINLNCKNIKISYFDSEREIKEVMLIDNFC